MHIRIDRHRRADRASGLQSTDRDSYIVEHAKSFTMAGICVMKTPAEICAKSVAQSLSARED